eukprot:m.293220 g.293220  ORF g.293220 m.293220 type:complete len:74 (+) comp27138_c2_seq3:4415-4636(+)
MKFVVLSDYSSETVSTKLVHCCVRTLGLQKAFETRVDPVIAADGQTYERAPIEKWFEDDATSPLTGESYHTPL